MLASLLVADKLYLSDVHARSYRDFFTASQATNARRAVQRRRRADEGCEQAIPRRVDLAAEMLFNRSPGRLVVGRKLVTPRAVSDPRY